MAQLPGGKIDRATLAEGRQVFNTNCAVCHGGATGAGNGITTQYGMINPPTYHGQRLREVKDGYLYQIITEGKGMMAAYGLQVKPPDRWKIVAYVRTLQRANNANLHDVPTEHRGELSP